MSGAPEGYRSPPRAPAAATQSQILARAAIPAVLSQGHVPHLLSLLQRSAAPDQETQRHATTILEHCENVPGFVEQMIRLAVASASAFPLPPSMLDEGGAPRPIPRDARMKSAIMVHNVVRRHWRSFGSSARRVLEYTEKQGVREALLRLTVGGDPPIPSPLRARLSLALADVAAVDWPQRWGGLLPGFSKGMAAARFELASATQPGGGYPALPPAAAAGILRVLNVTHAVVKRIHGLIVRRRAFSAGPSAILLPVIAGLWQASAVRACEAVATASRRASSAAVATDGTAAAGGLDLDLGRAVWQDAGNDLHICRVCGKILRRLVAGAASGTMRSAQAQALVEAQVRFLRWVLPLRRACSSHVPTHSSHPAATSTVGSASGPVVVTSSTQGPEQLLLAAGKQSLLLLRASAQSHGADLAGPMAGAVRACAEQAGAEAALGDRDRDRDRDRGGGQGVGKRGPGPILSSVDFGGGRSVVLPAWRGVARASVIACQAVRLISDVISCSAFSPIVDGGAVEGASGLEMGLALRRMISDESFIRRLVTRVILPLCSVTSDEVAEWREDAEGFGLDQEADETDGERSVRASAQSLMVSLVDREQDCSLAVLEGAFRAADEAWGHRVVEMRRMCRSAAGAGPGPDAAREQRVASEVICLGPAECPAGSQAAASALDACFQLWGVCAYHFGYVTEFGSWSRGSFSTVVQMLPILRGLAADASRSGRVALHWRLLLRRVPWLAACYGGFVTQEAAAGILHCIAAGLACPDGAIRVAASQAMIDIVPSLARIEVAPGALSAVVGTSTSTAREQDGAAILASRGLLGDLLGSAVRGIGMSQRGDARLRYFELLHALTSTTPKHALADAAPRLMTEMQRLWTACRGQAHMRGHLLGTACRVLAGVSGGTKEAVKQVLGPALGLLREALGAGSASSDAASSLRHTAEDAMELWLTVLDAAPGLAPALVAPLGAAVAAGQACPACLPLAVEAVTSCCLLGGGVFPGDEAQAKATSEVLSLAAGAGMPATQMHAARGCDVIIRSMTSSSGGHAGAPPGRVQQKLGKAMQVVGPALHRLAKIAGLDASHGGAGAGALDCSTAVRVSCLTPLARVAILAPDALARILGIGGGPGPASPTAALPSPSGPGAGGNPVSAASAVLPFVDCLLSEFDAAAAGRPARQRLWALAIVASTCQVPLPMRLCAALQHAAMAAEDSGGTAGCLDVSLLPRPQQLLGEGVQVPGCLGAEPSPVLLASLRGGSGSVFSRGTGVVLHSLSATEVPSGAWGLDPEDDEDDDDGGGSGSGSQAPSQLWAAYAIEGNRVECQGPGGRVVSRSLGRDAGDAAARAVEAAAVAAESRASAFAATVEVSARALARSRAALTMADISVSGSFARLVADKVSALREKVGKASIARAAGPAGMAALRRLLELARA